MPEHYGSVLGLSGYAPSPKERQEQTKRSMSVSYSGEHPIVAEVRQRTYESWNATRKFRLQREDDRRFMEDQYSERDRRERQAKQIPSLQVHTVAQRIQSVMEDFRLSDIGIRVGPAAGGAGDEVAAIFNGIVQADMRHVRTRAAMATAMQECATTGMAWLQWIAIPVSPDNPLDQRLVLRAARNDHVYEDPYDTTRERSEMEWLIEVERMTISHRNARWPNAAGIEPSHFESPEGARDWWFPSGDVGPERDRECRVAFYYRKQYEEVEMAVMPGWSKPRRIITQGNEKDQTDVETRVAVATGRAAVIRGPVPYIEFAVVDGNVPISPIERLPYTMIPYARLVGQVVDSENEEEIPRGIVYYMKDSARWMSLNCSDMLNKQQFSSQDFFMVANEGDTGEFENPRQPGTKHYNAFMRTANQAGDPIPIPPPTYHSTNPAIESGVAVAGLIRELQAVASGAADAPMREETARVSSIQVLDRMDRHQAVGRRVFVWWYGNVTMQSLADIHLDMSESTYGREGRYLYVAGDSPDEEDQGAIVGIPFYRNDKGMPIPLPDLPLDQDRIPNPDAEEGDATMEFKVIRFYPRKDRVKVTPYSGISETSGTDAALEIMTNVSQANPLLQEDMALPIAKILARRYPELSDAVRSIEAKQPPLPEKDMSAKESFRVVGQQRQEINRLQQENEQLRAAADTNEAAKSIEEMRGEFKAATTELQDATKRYIAQLQANTQLTIAGHQQAHEESMQTDKQAHEATLKGAEMANTNRQADADRKAAAQKPQPKEKTSGRRAGRRGGQR